MSKFLLLLGPSGVGKSTIIDELLRMDNKFIYISPYMTRPLRDGEKNKISVNNEEIDMMWSEGKLLVINELYDGIRYATPILPIIQALALGYYPVLDWPIDQMNVMLNSFADKLYSVYLFPPSIEILSKHLEGDGRDTTGIRLCNAREELKKFFSKKYDDQFDLSVLSEEKEIAKIANIIYLNYLKSF